MKKILLIAFFITQAAWGAMSLEDCFQDAELYAHHERPVKPAEECFELIKEAPLKIEAKTSDGKYYFFGLRNMFYLESPAGTMLMAGHQTELRAIEKVWIDNLNRRIFVLQRDELLTFDLDFIGNVAPLKFAKSPRLSLVKSLNFISAETRFELTLMDGTVMNLNSDAESRNRSSRKPANFSQK